MRVEVYIPPYLTQGRTQPNFTVEENDWDYGGTYTITVDLYEGTTDTMRVSLLTGQFAIALPPVILTILFDDDSNIQYARQQYGI